MAAQKGLGVSHGNLEALLAAAEVAQGRARGTGRVLNDVDQGQWTTETIEAIATVLRNPGLAQVLADVQNSRATPPSLPTHMDPSHLKHDGGDALFQQTRSGRISRPPALPIDIPSVPGLTSASNAGNASHIEASRTDIPAMALLGASTTREGENSQPRSESISALQSVPPNADLKGLPAWPLPASGPGSRKRMSKEETLARRRARNKESASAHRRNKQAKLTEAETKLRAKEEAYEQLLAKCAGLENKIKQLEAIISSHQSVMPTPSETPLPTNMALPPLPTQFDPSLLQHDLSHYFPNQTPAALPTQAINHASVGSSAMDTTLYPFDYYAFLEMDGEEDAEFVPPTSPRESDDDSRRKDKGKKRRREDEDDDEFVDEDVEDEDLFLPIEDVPIPPVTQVQSAMRSLGVDNREDLAKLLNKMVNVGQADLTTEMREKLQVLVSLVEKGGTWGKEGKPGGG